MNTIHYNDTVQLQPCVATIGFFDGVHRGHQFLIHHLVETARKDGLQSTVITFDAHPRKVLQADYQPEMLSTLDSKLLLLSKTEVDNAVVLHFDNAMAAMSAREFMQQVLHDHLNVRKLFNLDISHFGQMIPAPGVYAVKVRLENTVVWKRGMMNVGNRPTFNGKQITLETHIFNFDGDIYDQLLLVGFVKRIRGEQKFDGPEELAAQLKVDEQTVLDLFEKKAE